MPPPESIHQKEWDWTLGHFDEPLNSPTILNIMHAYCINFGKYRKKYKEEQGNIILHI